MLQQTTLSIPLIQQPQTLSAFDTETFDTEAFVTFAKEFQFICSREQIPTACRGNAKISRDMDFHQTAQSWDLLALLAENNDFSHHRNLSQLLSQSLVRAPSLTPSSVSPALELLRLIPRQVSNLSISDASELGPQHQMHTLPWNESKREVSPLPPKDVFVEPLPVLSLVKDMLEFYAREVRWCHLESYEIILTKHLNSPMFKCAYV